MMGDRTRKKKRKPRRPALQVLIIPNQIKGCAMRGGIPLDIVFLEIWPAVAIEHAFADIYITDRAVSAGRGTRPGLRDTVVRFSDVLAAALGYLSTMTALVRVLREGTQHVGALPTRGAA